MLRVQRASSVRVMGGSSLRVKVKVSVTVAGSTCKGGARLCGLTLLYSVELIHCCKNSSTSKESNNTIISYQLFSEFSFQMISLKICVMKLFICCSTH